MLLVTSEEVQRRVHIEGPQSEMTELASWLFMHLDDDLRGQDMDSASRVQTTVHDLIEMLKGHMG